ncbi:hypothetical protein DL98DRAFT_514368 [Cadophora sp. DSE1049]|nr:hypothetical protein DL98DRAFT_514368 [Cadophora sp. DSE1049]
MPDFPSKTFLSYELIHKLRRSQFSRIANLVWKASSAQEAENSLRIFHTARVHFIRRRRHCIGTGHYSTRTWLEGLVDHLTSKYSSFSDELNHGFNLCSRDVKSVLYSSEVFRRVIHCKRGEIHELAFFGFLILILPDGLGLMFRLTVTTECWGRFPLAHLHMLYLHVRLTT